MIFFKNNEYSSTYSMLWRCVAGLVVPDVSNAQLSFETSQGTTNSGTQRHTTELNPK